MTLLQEAIRITITEHHQELTEGITARVRQEAAFKPDVSTLHVHTSNTGR